MICNIRYRSITKGYIGRSLSIDRLSTCKDPFAQPGSLFRNPEDPTRTNWIPLDRACHPAPTYLFTIDRFLNHWNQSSPTRSSGHDHSKVGQLTTASNDDSTPISTRFTPSTSTSKHKLNIFHTHITHRRMQSDQRRREAPEELKFLLGRTILVLGDSIDRNSVVHMCELIKKPIQVTSWKDIQRQAPMGSAAQDLTHQHGPNFEGFDQRGLPHLCHVPELDFVMVNGFHYGMDDDERFNSKGHPDWHLPGRFEDRIDQLVLPFVKGKNGLQRKIDLVVWSSGVWDVARFGTIDDQVGDDIHSPLSQERLAWWFDRAIACVEKVKETFPEARLIVRKMHRINVSSPEVRWMQDV